LHLAEAGIDTALLEAQGPGFGASGRNGGQVISCFKDDPESMVALFGKDVGERINALGANAGALVESLITRHGIDCAYRRDGWLMAVPGRRGLPALENRARQWQERGMPVRILNRSETTALVGADIYEAAYLNPMGGQLNPLSFARGLARGAIAQGVKLHTNSPVRSITREGQQWRVATAHGAVLANQVVVATGAYTTDVVPSLKESILPVQSIQVATPPLPEEIRRTILPLGHAVADTRRLLLYFRFNEQGRFVFGGRGSLNRDAVAANHAKAVVDSMCRSFPQLAGIPIDHVWAGQVDITPERRVRIHELADALASGNLRNAPLPVTPLRPVPFHSFRLPAMVLAAQWFRLLDKIDAQ
jgi:sarcosine oxidase